MEQGKAVAYALNALEDRGVLFISPGDDLYEGMRQGLGYKYQHQARRLADFVSFMPFAASW